MYETRRLAQFVAETSFADLPPSLVERAKVFILDNLAAGLVGSGQPWSRMVSGLGRELGGNGDLSVFARSWGADVSRATLVNGVMMGAFESEHVGHVAHPSATVFPAALAVAERDHADGQAFLAALLLGYEVVCRVGEAQTRAVEDGRGFHNPGVNGAFGAAAAVGKLVGLDAQGLAWALGVAGSHACGLVEFIWEGAMTKRMHPGRAAQLGLESALLAQRGFSGPTTVLEGRHGYLQAYSPQPRPERLVKELGTRWLAGDMTIKAYPCHVTGQAVAHAMQQLRRDRDIPASAVGRVVVSVSPHAAQDRHMDRAPTTVLGAQYSLPFTTAVALTRNLAIPYALDQDVVDDPAVRALAARIEVRADEERFGHNTSGAEVVVDVNGEVHTALCEAFPGSAARPLDFDGAADKLRRYGAPMVGDARVREMVGLVAGLEGLSDTAQLARLIRAAR